MTTTIRRLAAATALPAVLMLTFTACGDDSDESGSSEETTESTDSGDTAETEGDTDAEGDTGTEGGAGAEGDAGMPEAGDIPDPREDPEGFEDYIEKTYVDAGMSAEQADCMAGAFMDNVDVDQLQDASAISEMMTDPALQEAMGACV